MTTSSRLAKTLATATAITLHGLALWAVTPDIEIEMEGSGGEMQASLGNSFSDMVEGTMSPAETEELTEPDAPEAEAEPTEPKTTEADQTEERTAETPPEETRPDVPKPVTQDTPEQPQQPQQAETATAPAAPDQTIADVAMAQDTETPEPETLQQTAPEEVQQAEPQPAVTPLAALEPTQAEPTRAAPVPSTNLAESAETIEADTETSPAVSRSLRPQNRPKAIEEEQERLARQREKERQQRQAEQRRQQQQQQAARQQPQGNASQNATTGAATGAETNRRQANTGTGQSSEAGNAAVSNYPGQVMRQISRVRRPQVGSRGTAVIAFTVSSSGGLAGLSLTRSSGNGRLDQAALGVVRRAAPFPAPPPGARRSFSINIKGG
ncbi:MAG: TonB family protein [Roseovarius sp.]